VAGAGLASAASPSSTGRLSIKINVANGFVPVAEQVTSQGSVVDTFQSSTATVKVVGSVGSSVSFFPVAATQDHPGGIELGMSAARPKTQADATAYHDSGRTVVGDLVALGMPLADAQSQFGDMETLGGSSASAAPTADAVQAVAMMPEQGSSDTATTAAGTTAQVASSSTTPYDTQCGNISINGGKISGYGCSTFYLMHQNGGDWWFDVKYKVSAHSSDTSWWSPERLTQLGWEVGWAVNNVLYDWDPANTNSVGSCSTLTVSATSPYGGISISGTICPNSLGLWNLTSRNSGAIWNGMEHSTDYEAAVGVQSVHNPSNAAASYTSTWTLSYCDLWC
jgi:hypothetical protein